MKKKFIIVILIFIVAIAWWKMPSYILPNSSSNISKIDIFNGSNGNEISITNTDQINKVISMFQDKKIYKKGPAFGYMGYLLRIKIYKGERIYKDFILNSNDTVRRNGIFYSLESTVDLNYFRTLTKENDATAQRE